MTRTSVAVLGGGSFGTVLANIAAENGHPACLWLRDEKLAQSIRQDRVNARYMPGYRLHPELRITTDIAAAVDAADLLLIAVPSKAFRETVRMLKPTLRREQLLVSTAKGVEEEGFVLMSQILQAECPAQAIGVLSGPNLAKEIAQRMLTATVIASQDEKVRTSVHSALANDYFRVYASNDMYGVELGGVLKNIYAIISGLASALGMGENTRSMLITRSLAEMSRFAVQMGANPLTFIGLAGVGDLIVTCMSPLSRNFRVGYALGKGEPLEQAVSGIGEVAEGVNTLRLVKQKADELKVYMPLVGVLYDVLYNRLSIAEAIKLLMSGSQSSDVDFVLPRETLD